MGVYKSGNTVFSQENLYLWSCLVRLTNSEDQGRVSRYFSQKRMVMGWLLKPSSLIKSGNLCVPFATHQSNHNLMRNREWIESSSCGMAVLRGNDILMTTHIYVMKVGIQWCQLESLRVLFYEAKVPTSDVYSTI